MTVPSGEVTVLMSWPRFVEAGRVNLMTAGTATTHRSRTVAIHRSGDAVPRAQAHHRSSPPWRDLAASASLLVRIRMLVPSDAACSSGASANTGALLPHVPRRQLDAPDRHLRSAHVGHLPVPGRTVARTRRTSSALAVGGYRFRNRPRDQVHDPGAGHGPGGWPRADGAAALARHALALAGRADRRGDARSESRVAGGAWLAHARIPRQPQCGHGGREPAHPLPLGATAADRDRRDAAVDRRARTPPAPSNLSNAWPGGGGGHADPARAACEELLRRTCVPTAAGCRGRLVRAAPEPPDERTLAAPAGRRVDRRAGGHLRRGGPDSPPGAASRLDGPIPLGRPPHRLRGHDRMARDGGNPRRCLPVLAAGRPRDRQSPGRQLWRGRRRRLVRSPTRASIGDQWS